MRHAYDCGIRFFETAESYRGMPDMLGIALKGLPRRVHPNDEVHHAQQSRSNQYPPRRFPPPVAIGIHRHHADALPAPADLGDGLPPYSTLSEAKGKKVILSHGASVHGLPALRTIPGNQWLDVMLLRTNHNGTRMDTPDQADVDVPGNVDEVVAHAEKKIHTQGMGVIGIELLQQGPLRACRGCARPL